MQVSMGIVVVLATITVGRSVANASDIPRDLQAVHEMSSLNVLRAILDDPKGAWVAATIERDPPGTQDRYIQHVGSMVTRFGGRCEIVARLSPRQGAAPAVNRYLVEQRAPYHGPGRGDFDPLLSGGADIIARITHVENRVATFDHVFVIPSGWAHDAAGALEYLARHPALLTPTPRSNAPEEMTKLIRGNNRFLAVAAFRAMAASDSANPAIGDALLHAKGLLQATEAYLLMVGAAKAPTVVASGIDRAVRSATSIAELGPIALAADAAVRTYGRGPVRTAGAKAMDLVDARRSAFRPATQDRYLSAIRRDVDQHLRPSRSQKMDPTNVKGG